MQRAERSFCRHGIVYNMNERAVDSALFSYKDRIKIEEICKGVSFKRVKGGCAVPEIISVVRNSPADKAGILRGDWLLSINGHEIRDVLDYRFYMTEKKLKVRVHREDKILELSLEKEEYGDLGLEFATFLMDAKQSCRNKCVFCFIDQLPQGMRDTLYFKDDDSRLSFLQGNYVTLTNMTDEDLKRIIDMHITPVNVSVHTTNGELRVKMMKNRFASEILRQIKILADGGTQINCQIVLCKGLNDGEELERTMRDLEAFYPAVDSVSVVPAGLTCHRKDLFPLEAYTPEECSDIIEQVRAFGDFCKEKHGTRIFYEADEFYIRSGRPLPPGDYYDGYPQLENGVGMMTSMEEELDEELLYVAKEYDLASERRLSIATGEAAYEYIRKLVAKIKNICYNTHVEVFKVENRFFGRSITVAGLLCGCDLLEQLKGKSLGSKLVIPDVMLRADKEVFLDDMTLEELSEGLGVPIETNDCTGQDFLRVLLS